MHAQHEELSRCTGCILQATLERQTDIHWRALAAFVSIGLNFLGLLGSSLHAMATANYAETGINWLHISH